MPLIVELGCGSGEKIVHSRRSAAGSGRHGRVHLIDISPQALEQSERTLGRLRHISVVGHRETYEVGLRQAAARARRRQSDARAAARLEHRQLRSRRRRTNSSRAIRGALAPGDALLLGADLVKPERDLQLAYDDPLGVTAAFNRNLLVRINRELGGDVRSRRLRARRRVEPRPQPRRDAPGKPRRAGRHDHGPRVDFARGERIWTESSYKYEPEEIDAMGLAAGFSTTEQWIDEDARFALTLLTVVGSR